MVTQPILQSSAAPRRQYAQPGGVHVLLGWPIRLIVGGTLTLIFGLAVFGLLGWPTPSHPTSTIVFVIGLALISIFISGIRVAAPEPFYAIELWYADFTQTSDAHVCALLERAAHTSQSVEHQRQGKARRKPKRLWPWVDD